MMYKNAPNRFEPAHLDDLLIHCHAINASDVTIQTGRVIFAEVYGELHPITTRPLSNSEVSDLLNALYGPNGTTQILSGADVDTHYEVKVNRATRLRHRVNATGCYVDGHEGLQITIRTIPSEPPKLDSMELPQDILDYYAPKDGVVYVTGATGSGKSTLLASMIREIAEDPNANRKIVTYEAPIEYVYDDLAMPTASVCQSEIPRHLPTFAAGVRNALRRKPGLILVGEARDAETMSAVLEAALTGHPVYTTLHSNGVAETVRRLVGNFPKEERVGRTIDIIETCRLIISQRLVPKKGGGRVAIRETLAFTEKVRDALLEADPDNITAATRELVKQHGTPMIQDIEAKFKADLIDERVYAQLKRSFNT